MGFDCISIAILASISVIVRVHVGASVSVSISGTLLMALLCIAALLPLLTTQVEQSSFATGHFFRWYSIS